jgi:uncharacterized protein (DUF433 family)
MLDQERTAKFITGFAPKEIRSETNVAKTSFTQTDFPFIEIANFTGGPRAVIRGTRVLVSIVIGYLSMGETPNTLVEKILPQLNLAQIHNAVEYYFAFKPQIDKERQENTEQAGRKFLREKLGEDNYRAITGE